MRSWVPTPNRWSSRASLAKCPPSKAPSSAASKTVVARSHGSAMLSHDPRVDGGCCPSLSIYCNTRMYYVPTYDHMHTYVYVSPSLSSSIHLSIYLSVCLSVYLSIQSYLIFSYLSIYLSIYCIYQSVCLSVCLFNFILSSLILSIYLSIHLSNQWEFQDPNGGTCHIKAIFWGAYPLHSPYIYGRYLQFRYLKWPLDKF